MLSLGPLKIRLWMPSLRSEERRVGKDSSSARLLAGVSPWAPPALFSVWPEWSAIADPSTPVLATGVTIGASGFTVSAAVLRVVVPRLPWGSVAVAATLSVKLVSFAGVIVSAV